MAKKKSVTNDSALAKDLKFVGRQLATEMAEKNPTQDVVEQVTEICSHPEAILELIDIFAAEKNKKNADDHLLQGYVVMMSDALASIGYKDDDDAFKKEIVLAIEKKLIDKLNAEELQPTSLLVILSQFREARLEPSSDMVEVIQKSLEERAGEEGETIDFDGIDENPFVEMLEQVEGDVFQFANMFLENAEITPDEISVKIIEVAFLSDEKGIHEGVLGCLLSDKPAIRKGLLETLNIVVDHGKVTGVMLRRMIAVRNWLPEDERSALDDVIKKCKKKKVQCASWPKQPTIKQVWTSGVDGVGAQSIFIVAKEGRRHAVASLLLKQGKGVRDSFVMHQMTLAQVREVLGSIKMQLYLMENTMDYVKEAILRFLAVNHESGEMPRYSLLEVAEATGLSGLNPEKQTTQDLVDALCEKIPAKIDDDRIEEALENSSDWSEEHYEMAQSWFVDGEDVEKIAQSKASVETKLDQILKGPMEKRRTWWAELFIRMATMIRHHERMKLGQKEEAAGWIDFALVAKELLGNRPLKEFPVMVEIAEASVRPSGGFLTLDDLFS